MAEKPQGADNSVRTSSKRRGKKKIVFIIIALLVIAAGSYFGYRYMQAKKEIARLSNPTEAAREETAKLVERVATLVEVPSNETPTVATVSDASKLKSQPFFANAQNGDKVLIYSQAKKAILYRPSTNKVIEVAPVNIGANESSKTQNKKP